MRLALLPPTCTNTLEVKRGLTETLDANPLQACNDRQGHLDGEHPPSPFSPECHESWLARVPRPLLPAHGAVPLATVSLEVAQSHTWNTVEGWLFSGLDAMMSCGQGGNEDHSTIPHRQLLACPGHARNAPPALLVVPRRRGSVLTCPSAENETHV